MNIKGIPNQIGNQLKGPHGNCNRRTGLIAFHCSWRHYPARLCHARPYGSLKSGLLIKQVTGKQREPILSNFQTNFPALIPALRRNLSVSDSGV